VASSSGVTVVVGWGVVGGDEVVVGSVVVVVAVGSVVDVDEIGVVVVPSGSDVVVSTVVVVDAAVGVVLGPQPIVRPRQAASPISQTTRAPMTQFSGYAMPSGRVLGRG
jgi:hypothetical protein